MYTCIIDGFMVKYSYTVIDTSIHIYVQIAVARVRMARSAVSGTISSNSSDTEDSSDEVYRNTCVYICMYL